MVRSALNSCADGIISGHGHARTFDRTSYTRPRRLLAPLSLDERRSSRAARAARHPDEYFQFRKLLTDPENPVPIITRPRNACCWGAMGNALSVCDGRPSDRSSPYLLNKAWDCFDLNGAFPEFCAVGARPLQPKTRNRLAIEVQTESCARQHIVKLGIARVQGDSSQLRSGRLDASTELLESIVYTSAGDITCDKGVLGIMSPGAIPGLRFRLDNWCTGAPTWLDDGKLSVQVMLDIDMCRGRLAIGIDEWPSDPIVLEVPSLIDDSTEGAEWLPFIALTATGQSARLIDFHSRFEA